MAAAARGGFRSDGFARALVAAGAAASLAACATAPPPARLSSGARVRAYNRPYEVRGRWYTPADQPGYDRVGTASWYSYESHNRTTADGEPFDVRLATAAHTTLPIPSWLEVTNLQNGRSARLRLNDRGPFVAGRILDVSRGAAIELGFLQQGTARVRVRYLGPAGPTAGAPRAEWASAAPRQTAPRQAAAPRYSAEWTERQPARASASWDGAYARAAQSSALPAAAPHGPAPSLVQAEVDKDLADFGGDAPSGVSPPAQTPDR